MSKPPAWAPVALVAANAPTPTTVSSARRALLEARALWRAWRPFEREVLGWFVIVILLVGERRPVGVLT